MDWQAVQNSPAWYWLTAHQEWLLPIVALIALVESFALLGIVVPGVVLLASAAFLAGSIDTALPALLLAAAIGAIAGDGASFILGRYCQPYVSSHWPFRQHQSWLQRGRDFFQRYGLISILVGRFIGPVRPVMPLIAGTMNMPATQFFSMNLLSATLWAPVYVLPGYFAGQALGCSANVQLYTAAGLAFLLLTAACLWFIRRRYSTQP